MTDPVHQAIGYLARVLFKHYYPLQNGELSFSDLRTLS